ncbi:hypothetical protein [Sulfuracidifex tepidarius]|uniref:C2H2-type domain-containing protein n=1 Tax=Sulfuracidifex tepidarius TaxID=1294262 RepID=A0A510DZ99_9CREN|nr:hypothetical protein [Sulfuracidifex tepidarius]BBG22795.1 hypothetical protein IC006_0079 [Sulfuracidifex tepidarius]BBG25572.1 hypothetical protein IC007_0077 [Sulfuracidifex tepidarius]
MNPQKVTLFKALLHVGYLRVAPRTLSRGNNLVQLKFSDGTGKWYIDTPFGGGIYSSSKDALHALVLRFAVDVEDLKKMAEIGFTYAQEELDNYEKTINKIEQKSTKAFMDFMKEEKKNENENIDRSTLNDILREFKKQVVFSRLEKELERNNNTCPVCGKEFFSSASLYNHASRTSNMKEAHRNFLMLIMNEVTGLTP